jgi:hypothetical protein
MPTRSHIAAIVATTLVAPVALALGTPATGAAAPSGSSALARSPELSTTTRLADRRSIVVGTRAWEVGAEDGSYPAEGFHTRGEMGGFWTPPMKMLDGIWFAVDGQWLKGTSFSNGWGYARYGEVSTSGVGVSRTDFFPDGVRAGLVGLTFTSRNPRSIQLTMNAHSELMKSYPWGETTPSQTVYNLPDTGSFNGRSLVFREQGTPPVANAEAHDYAAVVGSTLAPTSAHLGPDFRGPQDPAVICPASGPNAPQQPDRCDDTAYGRGTGGELGYTVKLSKDTPKTVWFAVAGSDKGLADATIQRTTALADPAGLLAQKVSQRRDISARTTVSLPGDRQLQQSVEWSKQNIADARQEATNLALRVTNAGTNYPAPTGSLADAQWIGAGWPDYPWLFGTDGEYTAFAAVASGQFSAIENHLRTLRDISDQVNDRSGKVIHESVSDGSVFFGANSDNGNTDETVKFPSIVALIWRWTGDNAFRDDLYDFAVRNLKYVYSTLDTDNDGWPEGAGNVERTGMGPEKLDVSVYAIRGLRDLADLAGSKGDTATQTWAAQKADTLQGIFENTWWYAQAANGYADSLDDPGNVQLFQRYWIGLTPIEAELPATATSPAGPVSSSLNHANVAVQQRETPCYTAEFGLFHTGTPGCDPVISSAPADRTIFTLTTSVMSVAEAALGRMNPDQLPRYTTALARVQLDPSVSEVPGDMPEISPSPDFGANIDKRFTERSSGLQAWGTYGVLWPVVHYELGVAPDLGHGTLSVIPQVPAGQPSVAGKDIRVGSGSVDVSATRREKRLETSVTRHLSTHLNVGAVLPTGATPATVTLNGAPTAYRTVVTARGTEVLVDAGTGTGGAHLVVSLG